MMKIVKYTKNYIIALGLIVFCCMASLFSFVSVPVSTCDVMAEYNAFDSALSKMLDDYGDNETMTVSMQSETEEENLFNRLIVNSNLDIDSYGAIAEAEFRDVHIFQYETAEQTQTAYNYFCNLDGVDDVSYDAVVSVDYTLESSQSDELVASQASSSYMSWGASYVGYQDYKDALLSVKQESELPQVVVAVLDSGINTSHTLFQNRILHQHAKNFTNETSSTKYAYEDQNGHGTHVSGTIVESTFSNVKILPLKVLNKKGEGTVSMIVNAISHVITLTETTDLNIKMMNMSIGVDSSSAETASAKSVSLTNAVVSAYNAGVISIVSAGNENSNTTYAVPANVSCAITVSAVARDTDFFTGKELVFHGYRCDTTLGAIDGYYGYSNYGSRVDFCAPGTGIESAWIGSSTATEIATGTSMAAPHVTAAIALVYSHPFYENYTFSELNVLLQQNADKSNLHTSSPYPVSSAARDDYYGYGLVYVSTIGLLNSGYVEFSQTNEFPTDSFKLTLSYSELETGETAKIYYTTNEQISAFDKDSSDAILYQGAITVPAQTTKYTAVAYIYDSNSKLIKKSYLSSQTYYFNNRDLISSFDCELGTGGYVITKYKGKLETLELPSRILSLNVIGIGQLAFDGTNVKVLTLPSVDSFKIYERAFYYNSKLTEIYCSSNTIKIGSESFRYCTNLTTIELDNITEIGSFAFANNSKMTNTLFLPEIVDIGSHAFSGSGLETILLGPNIQSFGTQSSLALIKIYGYEDTVAESFAYDNNIEFYDLTLRITNDFPTRRIIKTSDDLNIELEFVGYLPDGTYTYSNSIAQSQISGKFELLSEYEYKVKITATDLVEGSYEISVNLTDAFGNSVSSKAIQIDVESDSTETFAVNFVEGNFEIYIDGESVSPASLLYKNHDYEIRVIAKSGYQLDSVVLNGVAQNANLPITATDLSQDLNFEITTSEKAELDISFDVGDNGKILVGSQEVTQGTVARNSSYSFTVEPNEGYQVKRVEVDGVLLRAVDGVYTIDGIISDKNIVVTFEKSKCQIYVTYGKGGSVLRQGVSAESATIEYGSDVTFDVLCSEGYQVDFITVNGEKIAMNGNSFTLNNVQESCDIVVSFKTVKKSIFSGEHSVIMYYFIIFAVLFVVFVIAKVVLMIVRKKKKAKIHL